MPNFENLEDTAALEAEKHAQALRLKDGLEYNYWTMAADLAEHRAKLSLYLWAFGHYNQPARVLEIGCGPLGGMLPLLQHASRRVGIDPLVEDYQAAGILLPDPGIEYVAAHFGTAWETAERFDAIISTDSLDHGDMGLHLLPKIVGLLAPRGRFYLHLHFRPADKLNESHDHSMTEPDLRMHLAESGLVIVSERWFPNDVDGMFPVPTLVAVYERPA